jgi:hypothetical protein
MSKRQEWTKTMKATDILVGANNKLEFHKGRLKFWQEQDTIVREEIKSSGIYVSESLAASPRGAAVGGMGIQKFSQTNNSYRAPSVSIDPELETQLQECFNKQYQHTAKVREYESWIEFLSGDHSPIVMEIADYLFFFEKTTEFEDQ